MARPDAVTTGAQRCIRNSPAPYSGFSSKGQGGRLQNPLVTDGVRHAGLGAPALREFIVGNENAGRGNAAGWTLDSLFLFFCFSGD